MRYLLLFILLFQLNSIIAQEIIFPIDENTGKIVFSEVVQVDGKSKNDLYFSARKWFVNSFKSSQNVIQLDDKDEGLIVGKANLDVRLSSKHRQNAGHVSFTVKIEFKDGRYRYNFTNLWHEAGSTKIVTPGDLKLNKPGGGMLSMGMKNWRGIKDQTNSTILLMTQELKKAMESNESQDIKW